MKSLLALSLLAGFAGAQDGAENAPDEPVDGLLRREDPDTRHQRSAHAILRGLFYGEADLDDNGGDLTIKEWGIGGDHRWPLIGGNGSFGISLDYGNRKYDFGGGAQFAGITDPWDHVQDLRLGGSYEALINSEWAWFGAATLAVGADEDADLDEGFYAEAAAGFKFLVQDNMELGLELIVYSEIEDDPSFYIFPVIEMQINEDSRITTVTDRTDPALAYLFDFNEEFTSYFGVGVKIRQYALDNNPLPDDTALKDQEVALRGGVMWSRDKFLVDAFLGVAIRELTVDSDDSELDQDEIDPAPFIGASVSYGFY